MQRSFSVFTSPEDGAFAKRYPALARLPCIFDGRPGYHRIANQYLMERGLGLWRPEGGRRTAIPTKRTIRDYADWLVNFLEWAHVRNVELATCSYAADIAGRYQSEMLNGTWSRDGKGRRASTANARVQQACDFLTWMVEKGLRGEFQIPYETQQITLGSATKAGGKITREVKTRGGKARASARRLSMPSREAVQRWLSAVYESAGPTFGLMCETILRTAMRREEVVALRLDTLPLDPTEWQISNTDVSEKHQLVAISIEYGAKGPSYGEDHGDKIGPDRPILIPLELAKKWHAYRNGARNLAFKRWLDGVKGADARRARAKEAVHLFLQPGDGHRFNGKQLYDAWVSVDLPIKGWSPHQGRHWWACTVLLRELSLHPHIGNLSNEIATALLEATATSIIQLQIQPQLGHSNDATTMIYVQWVVDRQSRAVSLEDDLDTTNE
ncbi:Site-specific recombinase XerD [Burkholderia pseudomallei]|nr:Site-specific recombinase XerD [Burkholderia pseudomallei]CAJ9571466.1 Site-specific recombinase XerD [Burkholderia pseudomallei]VCQ90370.1 Site-specific recombinase XerD [Burkholderia pseudomallei]